LSPTPEYATTMNSWAEPQSKKELQSFLGFAGFHAKFISGYSEIAAPLTELLKSDVLFHFGPAEKKAFEKLKCLLVSEPVLKQFDSSKQVILITDASNTGWGAVIQQE